MKWGAEHEPRGTILHYLTQRVGSFGRNLLGARQIARKVDEALSATVIDSQLLAGRNLASDIDAFTNLGLVKRWEQDLFARRLVIQLGVIAGDDIIPNRIEHTIGDPALLDGGNVEKSYRISHIRAIDDAAHRVSLAMAGGLEDKQLPSGDPYLASRIITLLKFAEETRNNQPSEKLYRPSTETIETLQGIFADFRTKLVSIRKAYSPDYPAA